MAIKPKHRNNYIHGINALRDLQSLRERMTGFKAFQFPDWTLPALFALEDELRRFCVEMFAPETPEVIARMAPDLRPIATDTLARDHKAKAA